MGSGLRQVFYPIWQELGALHGRMIVDPDEYASIEGEGGKVFIVYLDTDRLEQHMKDLALGGANLP